MDRDSAGVEAAACSDETELRELYEIEGAGTERYDSSSFWDARYHLRRKSTVDRMLESLISSGDAFLDVGCGTGEYLSTARRLGAEVVVGADIAATYLRRLQSHESRASLVQASGVSLPFAPQSFDVVLCSEVIEHVPDEVASAMVGELARIARRSICITTPNRDAAIRRVARRIRPERIDALDLEVGHINLLSRQTLIDIARAHGLQASSWGVRHIAPPILGESLRLPSRLAPAIDRLEWAADRFFGSAGNTMYIVLEPAAA